jgi:quercetin dioxygenase-like cupin family protein
MSVEVVATKSVERFEVRGFCFPSDHVMRSHDHMGATMVFLHRGDYRGRMTHVEYTMGAGDWVVAPAGSGHGGVVGPTGASGVLIAPSVDHRASVASVSDGIKIVSCRRLKSLARSLAKELQATDAVAPLALEGVVLDIVATLSRARGRDRNAGSSVMSRL